MTSAKVKDLAREAVEAILEKKGRDILLIDVHKVSGVADLFILATGDSDVQIRAITDSVKSRLKEEFGERAWHIEGSDHLQWVLMDYVDLVIHLFSPERREFYALERLWGDARSETVADDGTSGDIALLAE